MIETTQVYLIKDHRWLMLLRNKKKNDENSGKWIAVGGKKEPDETVEQCALRETEEETGLRVTELLPQGTVYFNKNGIDLERIWIYKAVRFSGRLRKTDEGTLCWIPEDEVMNLNLWQGDRVFLRKMMDGQNGFSLRLIYDRFDQLLEVSEAE